MKSAKMMLALAFTMLPMLASAQLSSSDKVVTKVPFEFVVGNKTIPPGQCVVRAATPDLKTITVRNGDANVSLFSNISPVETATAATAPALVFHRYGDRYFLWGMKVEGTKTMYRLPETKAEMELRAQNVPVSEEILLAYLQ